MKIFYLFLILGLGYGAVLINAYIGFYYNVIIAYCLYYFVVSIRSELLWTNCPKDSSDCYIAKVSNETNCTQEKLDFMKNNSS